MASSTDKAKERAAVARHQRETDLKTVMSTPAGQRVLFALINEDAGVAMGSYSPEARDVALNMAFNEGRRSIGITLMNELQRAAPLQYQTMYLEAIRAENERQATLRAEAVPNPGDRRSS